MTTGKFIAIFEFTPYGNHTTNAQPLSRLGKRVMVKCMPSDSIGDFKKVLGLQIGTDWKKIILKKGYMIFKDHLTLDDYEIHDGTYLELYYA